MVQIYNETMTKDKIIASPKDEVLDGVIVNIEKGTLKEFVDKQYHEEFDNLDQEVFNLNFEVSFNDRIIKGHDRLNYYAEPLSNTKLAKFLTKYDELKAGVKVKVLYDSKGFGKIKVD